MKILNFPEIVTFTSVRFISDPTEDVRRENVLNFKLWERVLTGYRKPECMFSNLLPFLLVSSAS